MGYLQKWPRFTSVHVLTTAELASDGCYRLLCDMSRRESYAYLLSEGTLCDFLDYVGKADDNQRALNLYDLYVAYDIEFLGGTVSLIGNDGIKFFRIKSLEKLLLTLMILPPSNQYAVLISNLTAEKGRELQRNLLQQFVFLQMFLPVIFHENEMESIERIALGKETQQRDIYIMGTKKAGKSSIIDAILGDSYAPFSSETPTPNKVSFYHKKNGEHDILMKYKDETYVFSEAAELHHFLNEIFYEANTQGVELPSMEVYLKKFPILLRQFCLVDTPGSNFAGASDHGEAAFNLLYEAAHGFFVLNYSSHLTTDEISLFDAVYKKWGADNRKEPLLVAVNRIDEMYSAEVVKSPARVTDYIQHRLSELGYQNILVVTTSAILSVYKKEISELLANDTLDIRSELRKLRKENRYKDNLTAAVFIARSLRDIEDFYGIRVSSLEELERFSGVDMLLLLIRYTMGNKLLNSKKQQTEESKLKTISTSVL